MYSVYVIINEHKKLYIGQTDNIEKRLKRHNSELKTKSTSYTKINGGTWKLAYSEEYATREEALTRERQLKSFRGRQFIRKQIDTMGA